MVLLNFNPRTPCGVRPGGGVMQGAEAIISIHAPLAGCDRGLAWIALRWAAFQSTHPLRGATLEAALDAAVFTDFNPRTPCGVRPTVGRILKSSKGFQSTHPLRGATAGVRHQGVGAEISIHAPLAGCDPVLGAGHHGHPISIHAPLAGCDPCRRSCRIPSPYFNPRTPCGVRPGHAARVRKLRDISIHAPLAGCDPHRRETRCRP